MNLSESITFIITLTWSLIENGSAMPATKRMIYYQQPMPFYNGPQRMMYIQYVQPSSVFGRSIQAAEAMVAGERVATGTYLKETDIAAVAGPAKISNNPMIESPPYYENSVRDSSFDVYNSTQSIAEAYPARNISLVGGIPSDVDVVPEENEVSVYEVEEESKKVPHDYNLEHTCVKESNVNPATKSYEQTTNVAQTTSQEALIDTQLSTLETTTKTNDQGFINYSKTTSSSSETNINAEPDSIATKYDNDDGFTLPSKIGTIPFQQQPVSAPQETYLPAKNKINLKSDDTTKNEKNDKTATNNSKSMPSSRRVAKKKVFVELDSKHDIERDLQAPAITKVNVKEYPIESDIDTDNDFSDDNNDDDEAEKGEEIDEEEEELGIVHVPIITKKTNHQTTRKQQVSRKTIKANQDAKPSRPTPPNSGSFFPVEFGGTGGGAIAIANSYSTGESGTASSHAIAYGTPDAIRSRLHARPSTLH